ncbi:MAG: hypothetical protein IKU13_05400 [Clostridia bacterium]|nr:hypothetical protein [Clostridia bacterium]
MFRPDNVSEIRWAFYVKLFKFFVSSVVVMIFIMAPTQGLLLVPFAVAYVPCAIGYVLFHTYFAIQAEKNAPPQEEIPAETKEE